VFSAAVAHGGTWLAVVGVLSSAIAAFFYLRVIVLMYFSDQDAVSDGEATVVAAPSVFTTLAIGVGALVTVLLGVLPGPLLDLAARSSLFLP
jgi:NADH-quinone oxidoreductase subunit N